ncbi:hypothetical protein ACET3Z_015166 [Daucus carota]
MDWENNPEEGKDAHTTNTITTINNNINTNSNNGGAGMFVKVMTDEQMEVLRKQIAVYATICQQLVDLHKSLTNQHDLAGVRMGNPYCDPSMGHKITGRQRWTPTPVQLQILERMFEQGNGTPSKQKIKEITSELSQHGQISETNVYNWFQNRRARSKRKQQVSAPNNAESEVETEVDSPNHNKTKSEDFQSQHESAPRSEELCFQNPEISSGMHSLDPGSHKVEPPYPSGSSSTPAASMGQMSFYGSMLSNSRMEHLIGKMENPGNYNTFLHPDDYNMTG